jgi:hypothetical protein
MGKRSGFTIIEQAIVLLPESLKIDQILPFLFQYSAASVSNFANLV